MKRSRKLHTVVTRFDLQPFITAFLMLDHAIILCNSKRHSLMKINQDFRPQDFSQRNATNTNVKYWLSRIDIIISLSYPSVFLLYPGHCQHNAHMLFLHGHNYVVGRRHGFLYGFAHSFYLLTILRRGWKLKWVRIWSKLQFVDIFIYGRCQ